MIKQILSVILVVIMVFITLIGCSSPVNETTSLQSEASLQQSQNEEQNLQNSINEESKSVDNDYVSEVSTVDKETSETTSKTENSIDVSIEESEVEDKSEIDVSIEESEVENKLENDTSIEESEEEHKPENDTSIEESEEESNSNVNKPEDNNQSDNLENPKNNNSSNNSESNTSDNEFNTDNSQVEEEELTWEYLFPDYSVTLFEKNDTGIYENVYVKLDTTEATKGHLLVTYKDPWAEELYITLGETASHSNAFVKTHVFTYTKDEFQGKTISIELPKTDALYEFGVFSILKGDSNGSSKLIIDLGQITMDGAVSFQDMEPSEEQIKLTETSEGIYSNKYLSIDTNTKDNGYVEVNYLEPNGYDIEVKITSNVINEYGSKATWHYNTKKKGKCSIKAALTYGNAEYEIMVVSTMKNDSTGVSRASTKAKLVIELQGVAEFAPFTLSTGEVIYNSDMMFIKKANEIATTCNNDFEVVAGIYDWLTEYLEYGISDYTAVGFYTCDLEKVYADKKGTCYDFAVILAAMIRSQGIPCKVVFGKYSETTSNTGHAWNEVYIRSDGSIKTDKLSVQGNKWCTLDPTYTYSAVDPSSRIEFMNNPDNYDWELYY